MLCASAAISCEAIGGPSPPCAAIGSHSRWQRNAAKGDSAADSADRADSAEDAEAPAHANSPARHGSDDDTPSTRTGPASSSSTSSQSAVSLLTSLLEAPDATMDGHLADLRMKRDRLKQEKNNVNNTIRNHVRKSSRLRAKARLLSSNDLLEVFAMRQRDQTAKEGAMAKKAKSDTAQQ